MATKAFLLFPQDDEALLPLADSTEQLKALLESVAAVVAVGKRLGVKVAYHRRNIDAFLLGLRGWVEGHYLDNPAQQLRVLLTKAPMDLGEKPVFDGQSEHLLYFFEDELMRLSYAEPELSEFAERIALYPEERYVVVNLAHAVRSSRSSLHLIREATGSIFARPEFLHIPFVVNHEDFEHWLATNDNLAFTLLDRRFFSRTTHVQQGRRVYLEVSTGRLWYLDNLHKDHYEVFDSQGNHFGTANLQGEVDEGRRIDGRTIEV